MSLIKKVTVGALAAVGALTLLGRGAKAPVVAESEPEKSPLPKHRKRARRRKPKRARNAKTT
jgi:hypothetical protein